MSREWTLGEPKVLVLNAQVRGWGIYGDKIDKHIIGHEMLNTYLMDEGNCEHYSRYLRHTTPPNHSKDWLEYTDELHYLTLEGMANSEHLARPSMTLGAAIVSYTDVHKDANKMKKVMTTIKRLRSYGLHIEWTSLVSENDQMFQTPSRTSARNVFGAGIMPLLTRVGQLLPNIERAILPLAPPTVEDIDLVAGELEYQLNNFCDINNYNWRVLHRLDEKELWQALTQ